MPRRKKAAKPSPAPSRVPHKEPYTSDRVRSVAERLREQSMRLEGLARGMDDAEVDSISVDGHAMLIRGLNQIDNFTDNCARAVRELKAENASIVEGYYPPEKPIRPRGGESR